MRLALAFVVLVGAYRSMPRAEACSCIERDRARGVSVTKVPRNARVMLMDVRSSEKLELVEVKSQKKLPFTYRRGARYDELVPHGLLDANKRYEIRENGQRVLDFETIDRIDWIAPAFSQAAGELVVRGPNSCNAGRRPFVIVTIKTEEPPPPGDEPVFAYVWRGALDTWAIDYAREPVVAEAYARPDGYEIYLGTSSMCSTSNMSIYGEIGERFGIQLVDLAGNRSSTMTFSLSSNQPRKL